MAKQRIMQVKFQKELNKLLLKHYHKQLSFNTRRAIMAKKRVLPCKELSSILRT